MSSRPDTREVRDHVHVEGVDLRPGTEFLAVEHGTRPARRRLVLCQFLRYVRTPTAEWVEAFDERRRFRAFHLDRIVTDPQA